MKCELIEKGKVPVRTRKGKENAEIVKRVLDFLESAESDKAIKFEFDNQPEAQRAQGTLCGYRVRHGLKFETRRKGTTLYVFTMGVVKDE